MERAWKREREGAALIVAVLLIVVLFGFSAALLGMGLGSNDAIGASVSKERSYSVADSGISLAMASLRSAYAPYYFPYYCRGRCGGGGYSARIDDIGNFYYRILSTGIYHTRTTELEAIAKRVVMDLGINAALTVQISPNAEVSVADGPGLPIDFRGEPGQILGFDHDEDGLILGDQSTAVYGATVNVLEHEGSQPGGITDFIVQGLHAGTQFQGVPAVTANDAPYMQEKIDKVVEYAREHAHTTINLAGSGNQLYTNNDGEFGSEGNYKVVYANSGLRSTLKFSGNFEGWGLLVIEAEEAEYCETEFSGKATWHGLVIYVEHDEHMAREGTPFKLVGGGSYETSPHIVGGTVVNLKGNRLEVGSNEDVVTCRGNSRVVYSSAAIRNSLMAASRSYNLVSYRVIR